jgi:hypothetical protein
MSNEISKLDHRQVDAESQLTAGSSWFRSDVVASHGSQGSEAMRTANVGFNIPTTIDIENAPHYAPARDLGL